QSVVTRYLFVQKSCKLLFFNSTIHIVTLPFTRLLVSLPGIKQTRYGWPMGIRRNLHEWRYTTFFSFLGKLHHEK
ncbi:hypothetical protein, partial [Megasphaera sp.]|uniref:hypothetical protein n=1 Tax=Megasphaera sp. TaxID=2023260 RepID=UPI00308107D3